ncbi:MAG: molybdenum cofactor biosynthesis protein MoaE [Pseudomonadota bacterium]
MIRIQQETFDPGAEIKALTQDRTEIGAVVSFTGLVRGASSGGDDASHPTITAMTLEHYPGMTEAALADIEAEAHARWPLTGSVIIHRIGRLLPGEPIVLVVTASAHRRAAFEAAEFLMDWLKTKAPFWKREETDAGARWVEATEADEAATARWAQSSAG